MFGRRSDGKARRNLEARLAQSEADSAALAERLEALSKQFVRVHARLDAQQADHQALGEAIGVARTELTEESTARAAEVSAQVDVLATTIKEQLRRHIGAIDVLRRGAKNLDDRLTENDAHRRGDVERIHRVLADHSARFTEQVARLDAVAHQRTELEAQLTAITAAQAADRQARAADVAAIGQRADWLEAALRASNQRLDEADELRVALATTLDRLGESLAAAHGSAVDAQRRVNAVESTLVAATAAGARRDERLDRIDQHVGEMAGVLDAASRGVDLLSERTESMNDRLQSVERVAAGVERLRLDVENLAERVVAAEMVVNQAETMAMLLDRAEEMERMLGELDPDRYASRSELESLRSLVQEGVSIDHKA